MTGVLTPGPVGAAATRTAQVLADAAPRLLAGFHDAAPRAARVVTERLLAALYREGLPLPRRLAGQVRETGRYGFGRVTVAVADGTDPAAAAEGLPGAAATLADELADAAVNLALGYARRAGLDRRLRAEAAAGGARDLIALAAGRPADEQLLLFERLATEGHNLHPCGRTRLGWSPADVLAHDLEGPGTGVGFVAVRGDLHLGDDVGAALRGWYPGVPGGRPGEVVCPVHAWQLAAVLPARYRDLLDAGALRILDGPPLPAAPTAALRTVLLPPDADGVRRYLKLSLDIQVTSTRRSISVASTRNAAALSALVGRVLAADTGPAEADPAGGGAVLLGEPAGSAASAGPGRDRDLAVIVRDGLSGRLRPGEVAVPGTALTAVSPLSGRPVVAELVDRHPGGALGFLDDYARVLLPPLLRLLAGHGVAMEAHLQNTIVTFAGGRPARLVLRDTSGMRVHLPRLAAAGHRVRLWPGSVVVTTDLEQARAKLAYTALQAHLGELVLQLVLGCGVGEAEAWRVVRAVLDETAAAAGGTAAAAADHAWLTAPVLPHKALVRMRLSGRPGDGYVPVPNPLSAARP